MSSPKAPNRWHNADLLRAAVLFFATWILLQFLWVTRSVILVTILAILLGVALSRGVDFLERFHIKRAFGTLLILAVVFGTIIGTGFLVAPALAEQTQDLTKKFPAALEKIESSMRRKPLGNAALNAATAGDPGAAQGGGGQQQPQASPQQGGQQQAKPQKGEPQAGQQQPGETQSGDSAQQQKAPGSGLIKLLSGHAGSFAQMIFPFLTNSFHAIAGLLLVIFLAAYFAVDPQLYRNAIIRIVPPSKRREADSLLTELGELLTRWLVARAAAMLIIGALTAGALAFLKVPAALALGLIAGLLEFIPFLGPIIAAIPAIAMAASVSPTTVVYVLILFVILNQIEGNIVTPLLMKSRLEVPPAVTIIAVAALGMIFGVLGMLIAEPLSAAVILAVKRLYVRKIESDGPSSPDIVTV